MITRNDLTQQQQDRLADLDLDWDEYDCVDNVRMARKDNPAEVAEYEAAREDGCCGFFDIEIPCTDGSTLMYGFNYGH